MGGEEGLPLKVFNVGHNKLSGPFPGFLYNNLTHILAQVGGWVRCWCVWLIDKVVACWGGTHAKTQGGNTHTLPRLLPPCTPPSSRHEHTPNSQYCLSAEEGCHLWVSVNGGDNTLACPGVAKTHSGLLPEDFAHLARQNMACVAADGAVYEIASVLAGKPVALQQAVAASGGTSKPVEPTASGKEIPPGAATPESKAAARQAVLDKASGGNSAAAWLAKASSATHMPVGAVIGVAVAVIVGVALLAVLGFVFVYR